MSSLVRSSPRRSERCTTPTRSILFQKLAIGWRTTARLRLPRGKYPQAPVAAGTVSQLAMAGFKSPTVRDMTFGVVACTAAVQVAV